MKKLGKKMNGSKETIEAYAVCNHYCQCGSCNYWGCSLYDNNEKYNATYQGSSSYSVSQQYTYYYSLG